ncbi:MAG TPA: histidine kinase dimerization/phospho-acceptor domain-containing protein [Cellvibrionaceae bacterium]
MTLDIRKAIHDIRNPLNTISVNAELGKLALSRKGDVDKALAAIEVILQECRTCADQLSQLSDTLQENAGE